MTAPTPGPVDPWQVITDLAHALLDDDGTEAASRAIDVLSRNGISLGTLDAGLKSWHGITREPQPAPERPRVLGHPDDGAEEWLAETYENADDGSVGYDRSEMIDAFSAGSDWAREQIAKYGRDENGRWHVLEPQPAPGPVLMAENQNLRRTVTRRDAAIERLRKVADVNVKAIERLGTDRARAIADLQKIIDHADDPCAVEDIAHAALEAIAENTGQ